MFEILVQKEQKYVEKARIKETKLNGETTKRINSGNATPSFTVKARHEIEIRIC